MKKYFFTLAVLLAAIISFAQPGKKPSSKEKVPTQKEMQALLNEAKESMENLDDDTKKMMDSMGIKMPDIKSIKKSMAGVSDVQLKKRTKMITGLCHKKILRESQLFLP